MVKQTLQGTNKKKISHTGFLIRMKTTNGRRIIQHRRKKGRKKVASF
uniref:Ribosomal protein L34 n=1 Tax=Hildenbrandia rivularis TaxID=135206 RepID=A0A1C9CFN6_9FLOR|nr:ribosomal protein L34 [Hildenbrandia rivularis]AOM67172.1 ribosomal protein L34 [Hildenbrandia rivularis]